MLVTVPICPLFEAASYILYVQRSVNFSLTTLNLITRSCLGISYLSC